jgi:hypothetical protein
MDDHLSGGELSTELSPEEQLGTCYLIFPPSLYELIIFILEALKSSWQSPVYSFFKPDVTFQYYNDRPCHIFTCAARKCKSQSGVVRRFQDSKDRSSTANLKHHALRCFGEDAVNEAITGKKSANRNGSIFALFARKGKQPVKYSHRVHSNPEVR